MGERKKETPSMSSALFLILTFLVSFSAAEQVQSQTEEQKTPSTPNSFGSSLVFSVQGDVYPNGYFYATINIGNPPKPYFLDIDTGSDLTWVQCAAGPGSKLLKAPNHPYKPNHNTLLCKDPLCKFVEQPKNSPCKNPNDQCDYEVHYADYGSSLGVVVRDSFPLKLTNGSDYKSMVVFGCGYDQVFSGPFPAPYVDGVLGLANGKSSIVSQLLGLGLTKNVIGHCFGGHGKGFLFIGDDFLPSGLVWAPKVPNSLNYYMAGPVELLFGGKTLGAKGLDVVFDSGSTYTYLNSQAYQATLALVKTSLQKKPLSPVKDGNLPVCWKGVKPLRGIDAVKNYFSPLALSFTNTKNVAFLLPPESYLIVTSHGNVCLGILNAADADLGSLNVIGDISMQDKLVVYDNVRDRIGWTSYSCSKLPKP